MSSLPELHYHNEASEEVRNAYLWYAERNRKAAKSFASEVNLAIEKIPRAPKRWPIFDGDVRRYVLHSFPYHIIYYVDPSSAIYVLAEGHVRRQPG